MKTPSSVIVFAVLFLISLAAACSAPPTVVPTATPTLAPTLTPPPTAVPATPTATPRVIAIPTVSANPNVQDPKFDALPSAKVYFGEIAGAGYRIEVPEKWNGDLVMYAHGYRGTAPALTVTNFPIRDFAIQQGYAWAASSYRANGYNPEDGVQDTLILRELFKQKIGVPKRTYLFEAWSQIIDRAHT